MSAGQRPLSPHLQVYRPQLTMVLSITHRATGCALVAGTLLMVYWLDSIALGPVAYGHAQAFIGSFIGRILLLGWTFSLFYHLCNGLRHLAWDIGWGLDIATVFKTGRAVVAASVALTAATWIIGYIVR